MLLVVLDASLLSFYLILKEDEEVFWKTAAVQSFSLSAKNSEGIRAKEERKKEER